MSNSGDPLKLIAIVLPEPLLSFIIEQQKVIERTWGPHHALRTPPHLTIIPPLSLTDSEFKNLEHKAGEIGSGNKSFLLEVNGFGAFKPRVVFLNSNVPEELKTLYGDWRNYLESQMPHVLNRYPDRPYHPHITLAHKDVSREQFKNIWGFYKQKEFSLSVEVNHFCVLDHSKTGWKVLKQYPLS